MGLERDGTGSGVGARRPGLLGALLALWIGTQLLVPLFRKFDFAPFRYHPQTFSWSMYTRPSLRYEVEVFRLGPGGQRHPVPGVERLVPGLQSPRPVAMVDPNYDAPRVQRRLARLVSRVAERGGGTFVVVMRWSEPGESVPREWRHQVTSAG